MIIKFFISICIVFLGTTATAEEKYPSRPITFIIPWPAGGTADASMRAIGESLSKNLGVPVIVENR
jgi:tripartite-type tricarboxylate transporter receptor subunit TctC